MTGGWRLRITGSPIQSLTREQQLTSIRGDAKRLVESSNHDPTAKLTVDEELQLYTRHLSIGIRTSSRCESTEDIA